MIILVVNLRVRQKLGISLAGQALQAGNVHVDDHVDRSSFDMLIVDCGFEMNFSPCFAVLYVFRRKMDHEALHIVIESREDELRSYFRRKGREAMIKRLTQLESVKNLVDNRYFNKQYHDVCPSDKGYLDFYDEIQLR